ncbi:hypothetical protein [Allofournierella sp.]|uniref:hypothetical protein n=1 Tax=Allofournierella sp. TaxID=1940256 RepID=UPI003AB285B5
MKRWQFWTGAGVCFVLAAVLAAWPAWGQAKRGALALAALAAALCAMGLAVRALAFGRQTLAFEELRPPPHRPRAPGQTPPPPAMPRALPLEEQCLGSLRGAVHALGALAPVFEAPPMLGWQFQRMRLALNRVLAAAEAGKARQTADFAVQYLPSAMQYLTACEAEGCPENAQDTLTKLALACEKQEDALAAGRYVTFEEEYAGLRAALEQAHFCWDTKK